jgi:hypothetical protein
MGYLQSTYKLFPKIVDVIAVYKQEKSDLLDRSFDGMVAYVRRHVPQLTVTDINWVGNAELAVQSPQLAPAPLDIHDINAEQLLPALLQLINAIANNAAGAQPPHAAGRGAVPGRGHLGGRGGRGAACDPLLFLI